MKNFVEFIILILLCLFKTYFSFDYNGTCATLNNDSPCKPFLKYSSFYLASNETQVQIQQQITDIFSFLNTTNKDCISIATVGICLDYYKPCLKVNLTDISIALASYPCRSLCEQIISPCKDFVDLLGISCTQRDSDGFDSFPVTSTIYDLSGFGGDSFESVNCSSSLSGIINNNLTVNCPKPLIGVSDKDKQEKSIYYFLSESSNCALPCPFGFYSDSQLSLITITKKIFYSISFIFVVFLIVTYSFVTNKITHRMELILYGAICLLVLTVSYWFEISQENFQCSNDPGRYKEQSDDVCGLSGFLFQFGAIGTILWVPAISMDLYLTISMKTIKHFTKFKFIIWGIIILLSVLPATGKTYSATIATTSCWIGGQNNGAWQYVFFYIPAWLSLITFFITITLFSVSIFKMYKVLPDRNILIFNIKTLVFLVLLLFEFTFISSFKHVIEGKEDEYKVIIAKWVECIALNGEDQCILDIPGFPVRYLNVLCISISGLIYFIGFGLDSNTISLYKESKNITWLLSKFNIQWGSTVPKSNTSNKYDDSLSDSTIRNISSNSISMRSVK